MSITKQQADFFEHMFSIGYNPLASVSDAIDYAIEEEPIAFADALAIPYDEEQTPKTQFQFVRDLKKLKTQEGNVTLTSLMAADCKVALNTDYKIITVLLAVPFVTQDDDLRKFFNDQEGNLFDDWEFQQSPELAPNFTTPNRKLQTGEIFNLLLDEDDEDDVPDIIDKHSVIIYAETSTISPQVTQTITKADLPIIWQTQDNGKTAFLYKHGKCDGNIQENLQDIIVALINLY